MGFSYTIKGDSIIAAKAKAKAAIRRGMELEESNTIATIRRGTPRDRGWLQESERIEIAETVIGITMTVTAGGPVSGGIVDYSHYVHDGTRYMAARPYLKEGLERAAPNIEMSIVRELQREFGP